LKKKAGNTVEAKGTGKDFLSTAQVAQQQRKGIDKWVYMKLKYLQT
jgi:hypothetical protein